jgi:hypothetical protein
VNNYLDDWLRAQENKRISPEAKRGVIDLRENIKAKGRYFFRQAAKEKQVYQMGEDKQLKTMSRKEKLTIESAKRRETGKITDLGRKHRLTRP